MTVINTNVNALLTQSSLKTNERQMSVAMERLSTGNRINSAKDDAAGLAISSRMNSQVRGLDMAIRNANDAISMIQTADGGTVEISNMLQRMRELSVQSQNGTYTTSTDRAYMNKEFSQLQLEIQRIAENTQWNGRNVLDGTIADASNMLATTVVGPNSNIATTAVHAVAGAADHANNKWTIAGHGFANNDVVTYHKGGGTQPTGMTDGGTYHIVGVSGNDFQVAATSGGSAIALSSTNGHADQWFSKNTVTYTAHGFSTGDTIDYYDGGSTSMAGLTSGTTYYAIKVDDNTLQLASSAANAAAGTELAITAGGAAKGLGNNAQWLGKNTIAVTAHSYATGDKVMYNNGGGTSIGGLTTATEYYVVKHDANNIKLASSYANAVASTPVVVRLTSGGNAAQMLSSNVVSYQVGANDNQTITVAFGDFDTNLKTTYGSAINSSTIAISTAGSAASALTIIDQAISGIDNQRSTYGSAINRLQFALDNLSNVSMNTSASKSQIVDADYAKETSELARTQIIQQAATAMLSQANTLPQTILQLLQQ